MLRQSNHQLFTGNLHDILGDIAQGVDLDNALDLRQQTLNEPEIPASNTDNG